MQLYPSNATCCDADITEETAMIVDRRSGKAKRAKRIFHVRYLGETYPEDHELAGVPIAARFWHWSDQEVVEI